MAQGHIRCQLRKVISTFFAGRRLPQIRIQHDNASLGPSQALSARDFRPLVVLAGQAVVESAWVGSPFRASAINKSSWSNCCRDSSEMGRGYRVEGSYSRLVAVTGTCRSTVGRIQRMQHRPRWHELEMPTQG